MAINPIPVTFHLSADPRPELIEAQQRRARPYSVVVQGVAVFTILGFGFGFLASNMVPSPKGDLASAPKRSPASVAAVAPPAFPVWKPEAIARQLAAMPASAAIETDRTPVASIPPSGFRPVERAPNYSGIKVIAGQ